LVDLVLPSRNGQSSQDVVPPGQSLKFGEKVLYLFDRCQSLKVLLVQKLRSSKWGRLSAISSIAVAQLRIQISELRRNLGGFDQRQFFVGEVRGSNNTTVVPTAVLLAGISCRTQQVLSRPEVE